MDTDIFHTSGHAIVKCRTCKTVRRVGFTIEHKMWAHAGRPASSQAVSLQGHALAPFRDRHDFERILHRAAGICEACGAAATVRPVRGVKIEDKTCGERCMGATGPACECSCAGQNHGATYG